MGGRLGTDSLSAEDLWAQVLEDDLGPASDSDSVATVMPPALKESVEGQDHEEQLVILNTAVHPPMPPTKVSPLASLDASVATPDLAGQRKQRLLRVRENARNLKRIGKLLARRNVKHTRAQQRVKAKAKAKAKKAEAKKAATAAAAARKAEAKVTAATAAATRTAETKALAKAEAKKPQDQKADKSKAQLAKRKSGAERPDAESVGATAPPDYQCVDVAATIASLPNLSEMAQCELARLPCCVAPHGPSSGAKNYSLKSDSPSGPLVAEVQLENRCFRAKKCPSWPEGVKRTVSWYAQDPLAAWQDFKVKAGWP